MEISIAEAAKTLKVGRSTIYKKIESGELSRSHSGKIDTSELFRVFGSSAKTHKTPQDTTSETPLDKSQDTFKTLIDPEISAKIATLEAENRHLAERLAETRETLAKREQEANERESWQRGQIEKLTDTVRLLEAPKELKQSMKNNWFARLFRLN